MARQYKYFKYAINVDVDKEKEWIFEEYSNHSNNYKNKLFRVFNQLVQEESNFNDAYIADKCNMSLRTYKSYKADLVMAGLLQVRKINASSYIVCLGESAINIDDAMHKSVDYVRILKLALSSMEYTDNPVTEESDITVINSCDYETEYNAEFPESIKDINLFQKDN